MVKLNMDGVGGRSGMSPGDVKAGIDSVLLCIDSSVSGYNKGSLLSRFNSGESVIPDSIFTRIYEKSYGYYEMTGGAVDVAAAPLFDIWGFGFTSDSLPSAAEVAEIVSMCGMGRLKDRMLPGADGKVSPASLLKEGVDGPLPSLNYNAVAQGYSCDIVAGYLMSLGAEDMLVDVGGEIFCQGLNPGVGPGPCGVVTSGNYRKFYVKDGRKFAHTIDPRTGYPVSHSLLSATVIAPDAALADALATYCMVIGVEDAMEFISSTPDIEGYLIFSDGDRMKTWSSGGITVR